MCRESASIPEHSKIKIRMAGDQSSLKNKFPKSPYLLAMCIKALIHDVSLGFALKIIEEGGGGRILDEHTQIFYTYMIEILHNGKLCFVFKQFPNLSYSG